jgi:hypothetical protein
MLLTRQPARSLSASQGRWFGSFRPTRPVSSPTRRASWRLPAKLTTPPLLAIESPITPGFQPTAFSRDWVYWGSTYYEFPPQPLPQVDVASLLAFSKIPPNTQVSQTLHRQKRLLLDTMRQELFGNTNNETKKMYILRGHGVPAQLLQHHLDVADAWLARQNGAYELSVENLLGSMYYDRLAIHDEGIDRVIAWPPEWTTDMELYMTVVKRLGTELSRMLYDKPQEDCRETPKLKAWTMTVSSDRIMTNGLLPENFLVPVVEWIPPKTSRDQFGSVCIRIEGKASTRRKDKSSPSVSVTFNARFCLKQDQCPSDSFFM